MATIDGHNSRQRGKRLQVAAPLGSFASFKTSSRTHLVMVVGHTFSWDEWAASHDIQSDRAVSDSFWHIARLYHRCRRMGGTEAPAAAESWFSSLKLLYDPRHGPEIGALAERVDLHIADLRGNRADDEFVEQVASRVAASNLRRGNTLTNFDQRALLEWIKLEGYYYLLTTNY